MGTIIERPRKDGSTAYLAQVRARRNNRVAHTESKTFHRKGDAEAWVKRREGEFAAAGDDLRALKQRKRTLSDAIEFYVRESEKEIGRTKAQVLQAIRRYDIAGLPCAEVTSSEIVAFAKLLAKEGRGPATVQNYLSHLSAVFAIAKPAWGFPLNEKEAKDAYKVCNHLGIIDKSRRRDRRPSIEEMDRLMESFERRSAARQGVVPMGLVCAFALFSTRRLNEIVSLRWEDAALETGRALIRDMKHPGDKIGNDVWCELPAPALALLKATPRTGDRPFPYSTEAVSAAFTRACKALEIKDLHFHDLRHEGVSRLFEMGFTIPQASAVSGHRSWNSLQRYTHIRQSGDKWAGWPWLEKLVAPQA